MSVEWLMQWWNLIFIVPFGLDRFGRGDLMGEKGAAAVGH